MPSPHGVFCSSPHRAFVESPHGVRGCAQTADAFYVLLPTYDTPSKTMLYRIGGGSIIWQADLTEQLGQGPSQGLMRVEYNSLGLYCTLYDNAGAVIVRVNQDTGEILNQTRVVPPLPVGISNTTCAPPICANRNHLFSIDYSFTPFIRFNCRKYDAELNVIVSKFTNIVPLPGGQVGSPNGARHINGRVNTITPGGLPRIGPHALDATTLNLAAAYPVPNNGATSASMAASVLIAEGVDIFTSRVSFPAGGAIARNGEYVGSSANANLSNARIPGGLTVERGCVREYAAGIPAEYLTLLSGGSTIVYAYDPFDQITNVFVTAALNTPQMTPAQTLLWSLDLRTVLPVGPDAVVRALVIRTYLGAIRVAGTVTEGGEVGVFAAQVNTPDTAPALGWYVVLRSDAGSGLFYDRMQAASAVLGSGEDAPYTPAL
jgi:hypothetical protein